MRLKKPLEVVEERTSGFDSEYDAESGIDMSDDESSQDGVSAMGSEKYGISVKNMDSSFNSNLL